MNSVCAVIVTYNRSELLCRCIRYLQKQDYPLDVLIYDNHSSENVKKILEDEKLLNDNTIYYYAEVNSGGAGGFYYGMEMAIKRGYKYLWLMDDDGYPMHQNTLSTLMEDIPRIKGNKFCLNSLVVQNEDGTKASFAVQREYAVSSIKKNAANGLIYNEIMPFNGTLISSDLVKQIGYPVKEFFVYGDENEYYLRIRNSGAIMAIDINSLYYHPTNVEKVVMVFGKKIYYVKMPRWKTYCAARNKTYIAKKYFGMSGVLKLTLRDLLYIIVVPGDRVGRLIETVKGRKDGLQNKFDRKLDFSK